jgi:hypothetical protein
MWMKPRILHDEEDKFINKIHHNKNTGKKIVGVEDGCSSFFRNVCVRFYQKLQAIVAYIQHYEC